ncbi:putative manganese transporter [Moritella sp. Urea-trap-13]|uniref:putative manganese transporter n=1 Tax=Moritella sp. Urea-trap-13 TaxID=2058327 RepID=UPI000C334F37|nr:putative manganese transporter [Moritella sp. Urea-trap-13]PKH05492.1 hypothetical protein CXF93_17630 [Moritella sp. Urea-trap-13]
MVQAISTQLKKHANSNSWQLHNKRLLLPVTLLVLLLLPDTRALTINVLADAFWQVAAYVAATLTLYHLISARLNKHGQFSQLLQRNRQLQVLFAALMGALPGCGGAIVVITQYVNGRLSFGAVVAVLTATMGDAAFLLLAAEPSTGLLLLAVGAVIGVISGLIVDALHGVDFLRPTVTTPRRSPSEELKPMLKLQGIFWQWLLLPASIIAIMGSLQIDIDSVFFLPPNSINIIGAILVTFSMLLWATSREITNYESAVSEDPKSQASDLLQRVGQDTNFVTSWVIGAFLLFELTMHWTGINLESLFQNWLLLLPLMGVIIGLFPGCGPQILVTSLYLSGAVPLSTQLGNAISNDGDALFPAIAMAPKAALTATLYSSIPAIISAYAYFFVFEV